MANSKYEYVRAFEQPDSLLPNTWIVVRVDGRGFHKLSAKYGWERPNDLGAIELMNAAAVGVMRELPDLIAAYGASDEYSFVFHKDCSLFDRRAQKLVTTIATTFTTYFVMLWPSHFPEKSLSTPVPSFDGRAVCYPSKQNLRDYLSWRQVDCHINNLYNTTFWAMVQQGGMDTREAEEALKGTIASDKNEILFSQFGINYNNEPDAFKKGSVVFRDYERAEKRTPAPSAEAMSTAEEPYQTNTSGKIHTTPSRTTAEKDRKTKAKAKIVVEHVDLIKDDFWNERPWILTGRPGKLPKEI